MIETSFFLIKNALKKVRILYKGIKEHVLWKLGGILFSINYLSCIGKKFIVELDQEDFKIFS